MNELSGLGADLLGTFAVAIGAAALLYALGHAMRSAGRPLPRWVLPVGIGLSMIGYATWNEYSWAGRVKDQLPERVQVIAEGSVQSPLRPWTYIVAPTARLALIDPNAVREAEGDAGAQVVPVMLLERWKRSVTVEQGINCATGETRPPGEEWRQAVAGDPAFGAVCTSG
ncbi:hypothetical protein [Paracoccus albus]|uniref:hypothetical protein n=1 Tax=Paracoccus albus TaxID=3017784 RepID=UPI0022EFFDF1|nr:hypothetical protein [Paracoccus albus]WBU59124.1 hypothetical protein PAF20_09965 [Paracoccus albus]